MPTRAAAVSFAYQRCLLTVSISYMCALSSPVRKLFCISPLPHRLLRKRLHYFSIRLSGHRCGFFAPSFHIPLPSHEVRCFLSLCAWSLDSIVDNIIALSATSKAWGRLMFPGGVGSGLEPVYPLHGGAYPFVDSMPISSTPGVFSSCIGRSTLGAGVDRGCIAGGGMGARVDPAEGSPAEDEASKKEDRMLLRLLYHQQQSIQVQLNTMMEWMQQVDYRIASVERLFRRVCPSTADETTSNIPTSAAAPPFQSTFTADGYGTVAGKPQTAQLYSSSPALGVREVSLPHTGSAPTSVHSGQGPQQHGASSILESSCACTPPSEQTRHHTGGAGGGSAVPSTNRSLESVMAQPWDPHDTSFRSTSGAAAYSRTSSYTSALGRRANPLLASSTTVSKLPTSSLRPNWGDPKPLSKADASVPSGTAQTSFSSRFTSLDTQQPPPSRQQHQQSRQPPVVSPPTAAAVPYASAPLYTSADAAVPPYRRIPPESISRQTLGRAAAAAVVSTTAANRTSSVVSGAADAPLATSNREGTLPPAQNSSRATCSNHDDAQGCATTVAPVVDEAQQVPPTHSGTRSHQDPRAITDPATGASGATSGHGGGTGLPLASNDDSLSDGYGSYESRVYMKNIGLL